MRILYKLARRFQSFERLLPISWRVPFRYFASEKFFGGLEPEMKLLPQLVPRHGLSVDVGANRGTYTCALEKICKRVIAFEPIPDCVESLKAWAFNRNVEIHQNALGERVGEFTLYLPIAHGSVITTRASLLAGREKMIELPVQVRRLDDFELMGVGFIKIDVEGFELAVLKGSARTLQRSRPNLLVEIDPAQQRESFEATFDWLASKGYRAHYLDGHTLRPCAADIRDRQPGICNFIFLSERGVVVSAQHDGDGGELGMNSDAYV
ncbi:FkbM family methyltransferase [Dyella sp.]|uniref:FkbM family methyltransferase n=1 Tax=Dyella sp. TaxID=1869338 RepID=UPI003F80CFDD